ncbi:MAG: hypothetical protein IJL42_02040 [Bacteroidales bacterium]|nr:hypothetical protein [Bacteroidales bacterium]
MTVKAIQFISDKVKAFGISVSEADLLDVKLNTGLTDESEVTEDNMSAVALGLTFIIPQLLARPKSISEGGVSVSWDTKGLRDYYSLLCKQYGIEDMLSDEAKVTFR